MAHNDGQAATGRKVRLSTLYPEQHTSRFAESATIEHNGDRYLVVRNAEDFGEFHLTIAEGNAEKLYFASWDPPGVVYQPVHPSMTAEDIMGATHAEDKDGMWVFSHAAEEQHHDFEMLCEAVAVAVIQPYLNREIILALQNINNPGPVLNAALGKYNAWQAFFNSVLNDLRKGVRAEPLGHYHRNLDQAHIRVLLSKSVHTISRAWEKAKDTDTTILRHYSNISASFVPLISSLRDKPTIQTWPERRAADYEASKKIPEFPATPAPQAQSWTVGTAITPLVVPEADAIPDAVYTVAHIPTGIVFDADTRTFSGTPATTGAGTITVTATIPTGIVFDADTRTFSGTPATTGAGTITVTATNEKGTDTWAFPYTIVAAGE